MAKFEKGDKVKFLNAVGGGVVVKVTDTEVFVQDDTGFDMPFSPSELIRMADQTGVGKAFNDTTIGEVFLQKDTVKHEPTDAELKEENRLLRKQNADLQEQIKRLESQVLSLQRTLARIV